MNPMLAAKLDELNRVTDELRDAMAHAASIVERQAEEREAMQQEIWRLQRDLAALRRIEEDYDEVASINERYKRQREQLRQGLERILNHAKALGLEYQE